MGTRHLKRWLHRPVRIHDELEARLEAVEALKQLQLRGHTTASNLFPIWSAYWRALPFALRVRVILLACVTVYGRFLR